MSRRADRRLKTEQESVQHITGSAVSKDTTTEHALENQLPALFGNEIGGLHLAVRCTVGTGVNDVTVVPEDTSELPGDLITTVDTARGSRLLAGRHRCPLRIGRFRRHQQSVATEHYLL